MNANILQELILAGKNAAPLGVKFARWVIKLIESVPQRRTLWQIAKPAKLVIVASTSIEFDTGDYKRQCTGIGQLGAFACLLDSLSKTYESLSYENVYLSKQVRGEISGKLLKNDLLLLGSPKTNHISGKFLKRIHNCQVAKQQKNTIFWKEQVRIPWTRAEKFCGRTRRKKVISDYGLIVRARSPFQKGRTVVLFSGSHTYGTMAAAMYFVTEMLTDKKYLESKKERKGNIVALVRADVEGGFPVSISRVEGKFYAW